MISPQNNVPTSQAFTLRPVGFFPGLGSRSAYRTLECDLSLSDVPDICDAYTQGAAALGLEAKQMVLTPANLPEDRIERQAFLGAALLVHGIVLQRHLDSEAARAGTQIHFAAFTGESFGIITAAVAADALSIADGTKLAYLLAPFILIGAEGAQGVSPLQARIASLLAQSGVTQPLVAEPAHVVGLSGRPDALQKALATLKDRYSAQDVELHKVYSDHQANLYVRMGIRESFGLFMANFPELSLQELKEPTAFMAHAARMAPVREAFACIMDKEGIQFRDAHTPLICNHKAAIVQRAADIREAVLAVIDRVMQSRWTAERCEHVGANLVLELGQGDKSIRLLNDNGLTLPAIGYAGTPHATEAFVEAARLLQGFGETARSNMQSTDLTPDVLALLRQMFQVPARYPEIAEFLRREFAKTIAASQIDRRHPLAPMSRRFIEVYQHSNAAAGDLDLDAGELALQVQAKKTVVGDSHTLGRVNTEIKVLRADGTTVHRISNARWTPEALVFYCSRLEDHPAVELIHAGRRMAEHTPEIATLYRSSSAFLSFDLTDPLQMPSGMLQPRAIAALQILHQLAMLTLLRRERPAIFTSHDVYHAGGDLLGWCVALAATSALSARDAVALFATLLQTTEKRDVADPVERLDTILDRLRESTAPIIAASGVPLITIKDIARETRALFSKSHAAFGARRQKLRLNGDVQIVCLASSPAHETFDTTPFGSEVTLIATSADIGRRWHNTGHNTGHKRHDTAHNTALEALEHGCMSSLTGDNQRVLQFAQGRKILSSTVFSYIKLGEQVLGFGQGGSESMTIFVTQQS
jgi:malonyl CoA-acyl carrier protein transacylase